MKFMCAIFVGCMLLLAASSSWAAMDHGNMQGSYSDKAFLSGMIAHHEGALAMADEFLQRPLKKADSQVKTWAEDIKKAQVKEIAQMKTLLQKVGGLDKDAYAHMEAAMTDMLHAQKRAADHAMGFVEHMTPHHAGAIEMSVPALVHSGNAEIISLAELVPKIRTGMLACPSGGKNDVCKKETFCRFQSEGGFGGVDQ